MTLATKISPLLYKGELEKRLTKQLKLAKSELNSLMQQDFACVADAQKAKQRDFWGFPHERLFQEAAEQLSRSW